MNDDDVSLTCIPGLGDNKQKPREYTVDFITMNPALVSFQKRIYKWCVSKPGFVWKNPVLSRKIHQKVVLLKNSWKMTKFGDFQQFRQSLVHQIHDMIITKLYFCECHF